MGRVLVAYASRHGSTRGIAEAIGEVLAEKGAEVDVREVCEVESPAGYQAAVIGAPVHVGKWIREARHFVDRHTEVLSGMPVALFAAGMEIVAHPDKADELADKWLKHPCTKLSPVSKKAFAGMMERSKLSTFWRIAIAIVRSPAGDHRDWDEIRGWAAGLAGPLGLGGAEETP